MKRRGSYPRRRFTIFTRPWPTPATSCTIYKIVPEFPDIVVYIQALDKRIQGQTLQRVQIASPFLLRTVNPPLSSLEGKKSFDSAGLENVSASDLKTTSGSFST